MKKIAIITARSGSKGLPNKNVLLVNGKPLIAYSIETAVESGMFEKIIVSTDSQEYIDLLSHYPIEFIKRAKHLSGDNASSFVVIEDVLMQYKHLSHAYFVLLQPTSPLRTAKHIQEACEKFEANIENFDYLVSVSDAHKPTTLTRIIDEDESLKYFQLDYSNYARQQYKQEYSPNGSIFIAKSACYLKTKQFYGNRSLAYFMNKDVSVDIDDRLDFEYFYFLIQQQNKESILRNSIKQRIEYKKENFQEQVEITFIGHSILDQWNISEINNKKVANLAISGISTQEYIELIIEQGLINTLGSKVVIMTGTNDIVKKDWDNNSVLNNITILIDKLKSIRSDINVYFLEITPTALRADRNNKEIRLLNDHLKQNLRDVTWIALDEAFSDQYHKLDLRYSADGLHLNENGYQLLASILEKELA